MSTEGLRTAEVAGAHLEELERAHAEVLKRLALVAEFREDPTGRHVARVGTISAALARYLGLPTDHVGWIERAAPLHDVGKIAIPDRILLKADQLTPEEFNTIKSHTTLGAKILSGGRSRLLQIAEEIALTHHERWDGTGYPSGLRGEAIPLVGRIVAVADSFDAAIRARAYRRAKPIEVSITEIQARSGTQFDPCVVDAFLAHQKRMTASPD